MYLEMRDLFLGISRIFALANKRRHVLFYYSATICMQPLPFFFFFNIWVILGFYEL